MHRHLLQLRHNSGVEVADLGLTFSITDSQFGAHHEAELKPGGASTPVTHDNVIEYIHRWGCVFRLVHSCCVRGVGRLAAGGCRAPPLVAHWPGGEVHAAPAGASPGSSQVRGRAEAKAKRDENRADWLNRDPEIKCYLPGVPRANYMSFPLQIIQGGNETLIAYEFAGAVRNLVFKDPGPAPVDSWMGQSVAKWEGDTLVVTVTGQSDSTWFDRAGNHHSAGMTVVERWTLMDADHIRYEAEITDPETFTRPWKLSMVLYRRVGEDARLQQFKCVEFVEEMMFGKLRKNPLP